MPPSRGICKWYFSSVLQIFCMSIDFWFPSLLWPEQNSWYSAKWVLDDQLVQQTPKMRWSLLRIWVSGLIQANRARWAVIRQPPSSPPAAHLVQDCSRSLTCHPWIVHNTFSWPIPLHCWDRQHKVLSPKTNRDWWCGIGGGGDLDDGGGALVMMMPAGSLVWPDKQSPDKAYQPLQTWRGNFFQLKLQQDPCEAINMYKDKWTCGAIHKEGESIKAFKSCARTETRTSTNRVIPK